MATIKFTQGSTTWQEEVVNLSYTSICYEFMNVGNPQNENSVEYEIFDHNTFYCEGEFPLFCDEPEDSEFWFDIREAQDDTMQEIMVEIEKRCLI